MLQMVCQIGLLAAVIVTFASRLYTVEPIYDENYAKVFPADVTFNICFNFVLHVTFLYFSGAMSLIIP